MIEEIYLKALIADAAYIDFTTNPIIDGKITENYRDEFIERGWTEEQFEWFYNNFVVYKNANGDLAYQDNTPSGFVATMFDAENCSCISSTPYV